MRIFGLILAGGEGRRIGGNKPAKIFRGKPLIYWALAPFQDLDIDSLIISVRDKEQEEQIRDLLREGDFSKIHFLYDLEEFRGRGPLSGIFSALSTYPDEGLYVVIAVDQPLVNPELLRDLIALGKENYPSACAYETNRGIEPFPVVYSSFLKETLRDFLNFSPKPSIKAFLSYLSFKNSLVTSKNWHTIDPDRLSFLNLNTMDELRALDDICASI